MRFPAVLLLVCWGRIDSSHPTHPLRDEARHFICVVPTLSVVQFVWVSLLTPSDSFGVLQEAISSWIFLLSLNWPLLSFFRWNWWISCVPVRWIQPYWAKMWGSLMEILLLPQWSPMLQLNKKHVEWVNLPPSWRRRLHYLSFTHKDKLSLVFVIIPCIVGRPYSTLPRLFLQ